MELTGNIIESILVKSEDFTAKNCRKIIFKNIGDTNVSVGLREVIPEQEIVYHDSDVTINNVIPITFSDNGTERRLHVLQTIVNGVICRNKD